MSDSRKKQIPGAASGIRKLDWLLLAIIPLALVSAVIFLINRLISQSEQHVQEVKSIKVPYSKAQFLPEQEQLDKKIADDFKQNPDMNAAIYSEWKLSEQSFIYFSRMHNLVVLNIGQSDFNPAWLIHIVNLPLRELSLYGTALDDRSLEYVLRIKSLQILNIGATDITEVGLAKLTALPSLEQLLLSGCMIGDTAMKNIKKHDLDTLNIDDTKMSSECTKELTEMKKLRSLNLSGIPMSKEAIQRLSALPALRKLSLRQCKLDADKLEAVSQLKSLTHLSLQGNLFTDEGLEKLGNLSMLQELILDGCMNITPQAVKSLGMKLPKCRIQHRSSHRIIDLIDEELPNIFEN